MQTWRVAGLVLAVLTFGFVGGCGESGGGGDEPDADEETDGSEKDSGGAGRRDGGMDGGDEQDADEPENCVSTVGCGDLEAECGEPLDNCGRPLDCGKPGNDADECVDSSDPETDFFTCGGGGTPYKCGCTPKSCDDALICGTLADGCGGEIACGDDCESQYHTCGGGGTPFECGCAPKLGACGGAQCGTAADGCGNTVQCGSHGGGCSEARACNSGTKQCECKPTAELCEGKCGQQTIDGCSVNCGGSCGECAPNQACSTCTCPGASVCSNDACCTPEPQATTCGSDVCGTKTNNCGQPVNCGGCTGPAQCSQGQCVDPRMSAMVGQYAMRSISFSYDSGGSQGSRSEGYALVTISLRGGQLVMSEQACLSRVFAKIGSGSELSAPAAEIKPEVAGNFAALETTLDLSGTRDVPGVKEWFRDKPALAASGLGWRPGRPSYCPAPTAEVPRPAPSPSLPGYGATDGTGAKKPWLGGADCRCPEAEIAQSGHEPCNATTTPASQRAACMADWINLSIPYQTSRDPADVTDCRVIDEDGDDAPGVTIDGKATLGSITLGAAQLYSAATLANYFYGEIDESGARRHSGVVMDLPSARNSVLACGAVSGVGSTLCNTSLFRLCPPFRDDGSRSNPVDLVPLEQQQPPAGGWTCAAFGNPQIRAALFNPQQYPDYHDKYPPADKCELPM